jgi:hypothetical protein
LSYHEWEACIKKIILVITLILLVPITLPAADIIKIEPYIILQEEFSDNINLTASDKKSDFISTISPGIRLSDVSQTSSLNIDYRLGVNLFAHESQNDYTSHMAELNGSYALNPKVIFRIRDSYTRSDDTLERVYTLIGQNGEYLLSSNRQRFIYWRNVLEPEIEYRLGPESRVNLFYRDNVYRSDNPSSDDSREDFVNPSITYWLTQKHGINTEYAFVRGNFDRSADLDGHMARGRYMYRTSPGNILFGEYRFLRRNFDLNQPDYTVQNPSLGMDYAISPTVSGRFQIGYYWFSPESGSHESCPAGEISILKRLMDTSLSASAKWGFYENYFTSENLGFAKYYGLFGSIYHQFNLLTSMGIATSIEWADYEFNRNDRIWLLTAVLTHTPEKWLSISLEYNHRKNSSSVESFEYDENRIMIRLIASYI